MTTPTKPSSPDSVERDDEIGYLRQRNMELELLLKQVTPYVDAACGVLLLVEQHKSLLASRDRLKQLAKELKWES